jgi:hypothetical protein
MKKRVEKQKYPMIDLSGVDEESQKAILKALIEEEKRRARYTEDRRMRKKRMLFVCTGNVDRSPTAEAMFGSLKNVEVKSAGTSYAATVPITPNSSSGRT